MIASCVEAALGFLVPYMPLALAYVCTLSPRLYEALVTKTVYNASLHLVWQRQMRHSD